MNLLPVSSESEFMIGRQNVRKQFKKRRCLTLSVWENTPNDPASERPADRQKRTVIFEYDLKNTWRRHTRWGHSCPPLKLIDSSSNCVKSLKQHSNNIQTFGFHVSHWTTEISHKVHQTCNQALTVKRKKKVIVNRQEKRFHLKRFNNNGPAW